MHGPDPRRRARRETVAVLIGAEAGAAIGLIGFGSTPLAPLAMAALGAGLGPLAALAVRRARHALARRWLRDQLRATDH
jgi:hypothetical protein